MTTTPIAAGTNVSETIGGKEYSRALMSDPTGADAMGTVAGTPGAGTLLGRLLAIGTALGTPTDAAWTTGAGSVPSLLKAAIAAIVALDAGDASAANQATLNSAVGAPGDAAWTTGNATLIALGKALVAAIVALDAGDASAANQTTLNTAVGTPSDAAWTTGAGSLVALMKAAAGALISTDPVDLRNITGTISLPTGAAEQGTLSTINTKTPTTGQKVMTGSVPVVLASDFNSENHLGGVTGYSAVVTGTNTRPADTTAYAVGDLVANSTTAGSVTPVTLAVARVNNGTGSIRRIRLSTTKTGTAGTEVFRIHLFKNSPTVTNGDNGVFAAAGIAAIHLGYVDVTLDRVFTDGAKGIGVPAAGGEITFDPATGTPNIFALLEARSAYTPASGEVFTIAAETLRD